MAEDSELAAIRAKRLEELQGQYGGQNAAQMQQQQEAMQREAEMKNSLLSQILEQGARARLNSIALVKPEKAKMMESMLIQMARSGQIAGKLSESQLVSLLQEVSERTQKKTTVKFNRKRLDDSDDDDY
ncbi:programmed cell death protein 5-like [Stylophora pistillata]|uniref:Programmed cell death protein 5 n=1 Tax=Stylophora pistillata TaxID=50429 RepID=A0A2B4SQX4_STYPI|nr:programmed cell death protein 5-like [Stylophora pistillata]PFX32301.1 Programmed cell death protein 5 [Stylophora pistillata]